MKIKEVKFSNKFLKRTKKYTGKEKVLYHIRGNKTTIIGKEIDENNRLVYIVKENGVVFPQYAQNVQKEKDIIFEKRRVPILKKYRITGDKVKKEV